VAPCGNRVPEGRTALQGRIKNFPINDDGAFANGAVRTSKGGPVDEHGAQTAW
jgi:hypothetical protein